MQQLIVYYKIRGQLAVQVWKDIVVAESYFAHSQLEILSKEEVLEHHQDLTVSELVDIYPYRGKMN